MKKRHLRKAFKITTLETRLATEYAGYNNTSVPGTIFNAGYVYP